MKIEKAKLLADALGYSLDQFYLLCTDKEYVFYKNLYGRISFVNGNPKIDMFNLKDEKVGEEKLPDFDRPEVTNFSKLQNKADDEVESIAQQTISSINDADFDDIKEENKIEEEVVVSEAVDEKYYLSDKVKLILDKDKLVFNLTSSILIDKLKDELKETTSLVKRKQIKKCCVK